MGLAAATRHRVIQRSAWQPTAPHPPASTESTGRARAGCSASRPPHHQHCKLRMQRAPLPGVQFE
eukprot:6455608-Amphidinium_carterae.1